MLDLLADDILIWPEFGPGDAVLLSVVLALLLGIIFLVRLYYRREARQLADWYVMRNYSVRHGLKNDELKVLRVFFDSLEREESALIITSKRRFHSRLHDFFMVHNIGSEAIRVRILDKLFPQVDARLEVKSVKDLQLGEVCGVQFGDEHHLGHIMKYKENMILLSLPNWRASGNLAGTHIQVYVYRPKIGGFLLQGVIQKAGAGGLIFAQEGEIASQGELHLVAQMVLSLEITPWPSRASKVPLPDSSPEQSAGLELDNEIESGLISIPEILGGGSERVSDRALIFVFDQQSKFQVNERVLRAQELWQIEFTLPGTGYQFICRGRIMPLPGMRDRFVFKFLDASENARHVLFSEIRDQNGVREKLF